MSKLLVIKLGGSVITYKDSKIPKARISNIKQLVEQVKELFSGGFQIILVHGAGSFAHGFVKKYKLQHGMKTDQQKKVFSQVKNSMLKLNGIIMDYLFRAKLKAKSFAPHNFITQEAGKLNNFDITLIKRYLKENQIPVLFGDMVLDDKWGCSVLSGDTIATYLAKRLKADKVIFLSDVDGIYTSDPKKNPKAKHLAEITNENLTQVLKYLSLTRRDDVTQDMLGKILEIKNNLKGLEVVIARGLKKECLLQAAKHAQVGTKLLLH